MPRGASPKREREYTKLAGRFRKERRYPGREAEVAARIVNKQRKQYGETKDERAKDRQGRSPDRHLPIPHYQHLTAREIQRRAPGLTRKQLQQVIRYEKGHKNRKTVIGPLERRLA